MKKIQEKQNYLIFLLKQLYKKRIPGILDPNIFKDAAILEQLLDISVNKVLYINKIQKTQN